MNIQNYQIHNVLNVYRRLLSGESITVDSQILSEKKQKTLRSEIRSKPIMEKVAADILKKITSINRYDSSKFKKKNAHDGENKRLLNGNDHHQFIFSTVVKNNQKETRSITIDNSLNIINQLNELMKSKIVI